MRTADPLSVAYGMGLIAGFVGDNKKGVLDIAPVAVVNVMIASLTKKGREEL